MNEKDKKNKKEEEEERHRRSRRRRRKVSPSKAKLEHMLHFDPSLLLVTSILSILSVLPHYNTRVALSF